MGNYNNQDETNNKDNYSGMKDNYQKREQYGKKGTKPRDHSQVRKFNLKDVITNDIKYWNKTVEFDNVTAFPWSEIVGNNNKLDSVLPLTTSGSVNSTFAGSFPSTMILDAYLGPGWSDSGQSGVSRALTLIMARIRSTLSTSNIGFEVADLGIFLASTTSIMMLMGHVQKLMRMMNRWDARNYVYPKALAKMLHISYDDAINSVNNYTARLNSLIRQFNNWEIPHFVDIYDKQFALMNNIYLDEDSGFGQIYIFSPKNYYLYDDTTASAVSTEINRASFPSISTFIGVIEDMMEAWATSSDLFQINGVLKRAFKDSSRLEVPFYDKDEVAKPETDRAILMQIMNCTIVGKLSGLSVTQDASNPTYVNWKPVTTYTGTTSLNAAINANRIPNSKWLLRIFEDSVSKDDCMEMTRFTNFCNPTPINISDDTTPNFQYYLEQCGDTLISTITIYSYDPYTTALYSNELNSNYLLTTQPVDLKNMLAIQPFRYIPTIITATKNISWTASGVLGDMYNYMYYDRADWRNLQITAYQSLWLPSLT